MKPISSSEFIYRNFVCVNKGTKQWVSFISDDNIDFGCEIVLLWQMKITAAENYKGPFTVCHSCSKYTNVESLKNNNNNALQFFPHDNLLQWQEQQSVSSFGRVGACRHCAALSNTLRAQAVVSPHLFMGDRNESVFGELPHDVEICPHVQLAADQHHFGIGTELLRLPLPLCIRSTRTSN